MPVDRKLLEILVCPVTKQPVSMLEASKLQRLNELVAEGQIHTLDGTAVTEPLQEALITANGNTIYRVDDSIPVMLESESIPCEQVAGW